MNRKAVDYAKALVRVQGKEQALKIAETHEKTSSSEGFVTYFDEADFHVNEKTGAFELSKHQSGKNDGRKVTRVRKTKNFWKDVVIAMKKGQV